MPQSAHSGSGAASERQFDRAAAERTIERTIADALDDETTRVILVDADRVPIDARGRARPLSVAEAAVSSSARLGFLGRLDGAAVLVANADEASPVGATTWAPLRDVVVAGDHADAEMVVTAVALARWYRDAAHCPRCGALTELTTSGWARRCTACGREHFPRNDPAVIVAVTDGDRLLLGSNAMWEQNRYSCFAGFVEAGESLEDAVAREVEEEAGVRVGDVEYVASQAWPFPHSLMLGFRARALAPEDATADGEEILSVRWFTRSQIRAALSGGTDILLPGPASIARALITGWAQERA